MLNKKNIFKAIAFFNTLIMPSLFKNDITKLKSHEKLILAYRYWITKNSL